METVMTVIYAIAVVVLVIMAGVGMGIIAFRWPRPTRDYDETDADTRIAALGYKRIQKFDKADALVYKNVLKGNTVVIAWHDDPDGDLTCGLDSFSTSSGKSMRFSLPEWSAFATKVYEMTK